MKSETNDTTISDHKQSPSSGGFCSTLFSLTGLVLCAAGGALAFGLLPTGTLPGASLEQLGLSPALLCCTGLLSLGLAGLARTYRGGTQALAQALDPQLLLLAVQDQRTSIESALDGSRAHQEAISHALIALEQKLELMRQEARAASAKDSIFRLAASLDQLGARFDLRLGEVGGSLERSLYDMSLRIEEARDALERRFQETIQSIGTLSAEETLAQSYGDGFAYERERDDESPAAHASIENTHSALHEDPRAGELAVELESLPAPEPDVDLGVLSEISDEPALAAERGDVLDPLVWEQTPAEPPPPLPASLTDTAFARAQQAEGWWAQAERTRLK